MQSGGVLLAPASIAPRPILIKRLPRCHADRRRLFIPRLSTANRLLYLTVFFLDFQIFLMPIYY
jgi:hypothetical protein